MVGLAKNTGKTVTLNHMIAEAADAGLTLLLASLGRDGEYRDALGDHRKPAIRVPVGSFYATIDSFAGPPEYRALVGRIGIRTALGEVGVYRAVARARADGGPPAPHVVELCGLNRVDYLRRVKDDRRWIHDLLLIDGAVDRRAAAVPDVADGVVIATGAAVLDRHGVRPNDTDRCERVAAATADAVARFAIPVHDRPITVSLDDGEAATVLLTGDAGAVRSAFAPVLPGDSVSLPGSLTDLLAETLTSLPMAKSLTLVVEDATRVFVSPQVLLRLARRGVDVRVRRRIPIVAVTINPWTPWGSPLDSKGLVESVRNALPPELPVFDVLRHRLG